jgi:hypothetical protein
MSIIAENFHKLRFSQDPLIWTLSSCENFIQSLETEREIQKLAAVAKEEISPTAYAYNRWFITWIKFEHTAVYLFKRIFDYSVPYFINYFPDSTKLLQVKIEHKLAESRAPIFKELFKNNLLTRSLNVHQVENSDLYLHPDVMLRIRQFENGSFFCSSLSAKNFLMLDGICSGICDWFTYLYFKTMPFYADPESHLIAVAKMFENGAPRQAGLLQLFDRIHDKIREFFLDFEDKNEGKLFFKELTENKEKSFSFIKNLPVGVFLISFSTGLGTGHALRYFKIREDLEFLFDPNIGLIKLDRTCPHDLAETLLQITRFLKSSKDYSYFEFCKIIPQEGNTETKYRYTISVE